MHSYLDAEPPASSWGGLAEELFRAAKQGMQEWEARIRGEEAFQGAVVHSDVIYGPLPMVLNEMGAEHHADLVVMGTQGRSGAGILGSNAAGVVKQSRYPVLVVPAKAVQRTVRRILVADDQRGMGPEEAGILLDVAARTRAELVLAHVLRDGDEVPDPEQVAALDGLFQGMPHRFVAEEGKDVAGVIDFLADREAADLIAVLHRHAGFFEGLFHTSTAKRLALNTAIPLLVMQHRAAH